MTAPDPLSVICPLCGALPGEHCFVDRWLVVQSLTRYHAARIEEARWVQACNAESTRPL